MLPVLVELLTVKAAADPVERPVTVVVPVTPIVEPDCSEIAPAAELPTVTDPVEVPVLMLVLKLLLTFRLIAAPLMFAPRLPVRSCDTVSAPAFVVVSPVRPSVSALALIAPRVIVPVVPVAVPVSSAMPPELLVVPSALPDCIDILFELVEAAFVLLLDTLFDVKATGATFVFIRLPAFVISVSHDADPALPPTRIVIYRLSLQGMLPGKAVTEPRFTDT